MQQCDKAEVAKPAGWDDDLSSFAAYLKPKTPDQALRVSESHYYGVHVSCKLADGKLEIWDNGKHFEIELYSAESARIANQRIFDEITVQLKDWLKSSLTSI